MGRVRRKEKLEHALKGQVADNNGNYEQVKSNNEVSIVDVKTGAHDGIFEAFPIKFVYADERNARKFPVIRQEHVVSYLNQCEQKGEVPCYITVEKGKFVNHTPEHHHLYNHLKEQIDSIIRLAEQIKANKGLLQPIEVYQSGGITNNIVFGHRRYWSVVYLYGWDQTWQFKVLKEPPANLKVRQFAENNSRDNLSQGELLDAFIQAYEETKSIFKSSGVKKAGTEDYLKQLGLSKTQFYRLKKCSESKIVRDCFSYYLDKISLNECHSILASATKSFSEQGDIDNYVYKELKKLFIEKKLDIPQFFNELEITQDKEPIKKKKRQPKHFSFEKIESENVMKDLLTKDITKIEVPGVDWSSVNWSDKNQVNENLKCVIQHLNK